MAALALTAPSFACENPDEIVLTLRDQVPAVVQPGDVVLEIEPVTMRRFSVPRSILVDGKSFDWPDSFATFAVTRVVVGSFDYSEVTIMMPATSCSSLGTGVYLLAGPAATSEGGLSYLPVRGIKYAEYRANLDHDIKR